jgi:hypothetical protein
MENNFLRRKRLSGDARGAIRIYRDVVFAQNNLDDLEAGKTGLVTVGSSHHIKSEKMIIHFIICNVQYIRPVYNSHLWDLKSGRWIKVP